MSHEIEIKISGAPPVDFRNQYGHLEKRTSGVAAAKLSVEHTNGDALAEQIERFVLSSLSNDGAPVKFPSTAEAEKQCDTLTASLAEAQSMFEKESRRAEQLKSLHSGEIDSSERWMNRALEAWEVVCVLRGLVAGKGLRLPQGFKARHDVIKAWAIPPKSPRHV